jgi:hypothetical protein
MEALKAAFVQGRPGKDEFDRRVEAPARDLRIFRRL